MSIHVLDNNSEAVVSVTDGRESKKKPQAAYQEGGSFSWWPITVLNNRYAQVYIPIMLSASVVSVLVCFGHLSGCQHHSRVCVFSPWSWKANTQYNGCYCMHPGCICEWSSTKFVLERRGFLDMEVEEVLSDRLLAVTVVFHMYT